MQYNIDLYLVNLCETCEPKKFKKKKLLIKNCYNLYSVIVLHIKIVCALYLHLFLVGILNCSHRTNEFKENIVGRVRAGSENDSPKITSRQTRIAAKAPMLNFNVCPSCIDSQLSPQNPSRHTQR